MHTQINQTGGGRFYPGGKNALEKSIRGMYRRRLKDIGIEHLSKEEMDFLEQRYKEEGGSLKFKDWAYLYFYA